MKTETEMRAADTALVTQSAKGQRFAVPLAGARGQLQLTPAGHPRLRSVAGVSGETADGVLAVELERTAKGRGPLRRILAA